VLIGTRNAYRSLPGARLLPGGATESLNRMVKRAVRRSSPALDRRRFVRRMTDAGFRQLQILAPIPDEQKIMAVVPADRPEGLRYCFNRVLRRNSLTTRAAVAAINAAAAVGLAERMLPYYYLLFDRP
jgi:hypothetical protein